MTIATHGRGIESCAHSTTTGATRAEAHRAVAEFVGRYDGTRRHSTPGYVSPTHYERPLGPVTRAA